MEYWKEFKDLQPSDQRLIELSGRPKPYEDWLWQVDSKGLILLNKEGRPLMSKHKYPGEYQRKMFGR